MMSGAIARGASRRSLTLRIPLGSGPGQGAVALLRSSPAIAEERAYDDVPSLRLQMGGVVAEGLEQLLDCQTGTLGAQDFRDPQGPATTTIVWQGERVEIGAHSNDSGHTK